MKVLNLSPGIVRVDVDDHEYVLGAGEAVTVSGVVATRLITGHPELVLDESEEV